MSFYKVRNFFLDIASSSVLKYCIWMMLTIFPIWFATKFVQIVAPQSAGSGVPELKAIIRGVEVKDFLTVECLFAKLVGLLAVLTVAFPLGKEAAFMHIAAILAHLLSTKSANSDIFSNELKQRDVLVSASAIGLASALVSPIGGRVTLDNLSFFVKTFLIHRISICDRVKFNLLFNPSLLAWFLWIYSLRHSYFLFIFLDL